MDDPPRIDPNVELAAERTMLSWVRTGLALMGFGFVVARFGLFLRELSSTHHREPGPALGFSLWVGVGLVVLGMVALVSSSVRHMRMIRRLRSGELPNFSFVPAIAVAASLALLGAILSVYLVISSR